MNECIIITIEGLTPIAVTLDEAIRIRNDLTKQINETQQPIAENNGRHRPLKN